MVPRTHRNLKWAVEIGKIDIVIEVSLLSTHLAIPRERQLEQVLHIFEYLKIRKKMRLIFDCSYQIISSKIFNKYDWFDLSRDAKDAITPNMPESSKHEVSISIFVDADLAGDKFTRHIQTWVLILINEDTID